MPAPITTHVLDTAQGRPADKVWVQLEHLALDGGWQTLGEGHTDQNGRLTNLLADGHTLEPGVYKLNFEVQNYFSALNIQSFFPNIQVVFEVLQGDQHYHVPLLVSPYGYSTYRGS